MHNIYKSAIVGYSACQMFDLVNNINDYPTFLHWCSQSNILEQNNEQIIASIKINKAGFSQNFTTINTLTPCTTIAMSLKDGPFKSLSGKWSFHELNATACKIEFSLGFEFSSKIMDITLSPAFSHIANSQLESFITRAKEVYG